MTRAAIYAAIDAERDRQAAKWGTDPMPFSLPSDIYSTDEWEAKRNCDEAMARGECTHSLVICEEAAEVYRAAREVELVRGLVASQRHVSPHLVGSHERLRTELIQLAASAVKALEQLGGS